VIPGGSCVHPFGRLVFAVAVPLDPVEGLPLMMTARCTSVTFAPAGRTKRWSLRTPKP
jgi:hypothetical protein